MRRHQHVQAAGLNLASRTHGSLAPDTGCAPSRSFERARSHLVSGLPTVPHAGGEGVCRMAKSQNRVTSKAVASKASKALSDGRSSSRTKSIAASALSQRKK